MRPSRFNCFQIQQSSESDKGIRVWSAINKDFYPYESGMNTMHLIKGPLELRLKDVSDTVDFKKLLELQDQ